MKNKKILQLNLLIFLMLFVSVSLFFTINEIKKSNQILDSSHISLEEIGLFSLGENKNIENIGDTFSGGGGSSKKKNNNCDPEINDETQKILEKIVPDKNPEERLEEINKKIKETNARWNASLNSKALMPTEEKRKLIGNLKSLKEIQKDIKKTPLVFSGNLPSSFDWRNKDGKNWMTSVKDQGGCWVGSHIDFNLSYAECINQGYSWVGCGSCWAFSAIGTVEAVFNIYNNNPNLNLDLSEQQLVSDGGNCCSLCGNCNGGIISRSLNFMKFGIVSEECFPYVASTSQCNLCSDWREKRYFIEKYSFVYPYTTEAYKQALMTYGPLSVIMKTSDLFYYYKEGIYEELEDLEFLERYANHGMVVVGWNDAGGYWILKNSWGKDWGENGYGKLAYGDIEKYEYAIYVELKIECNKDLDCGESGFIETKNPFCYQGNVWQDFKENKCNNAGTTFSYCTSNTEPKLKEECKYGCDSGTCKKPDLIVEDLKIQKIEDKKIFLTFIIKNIGNAIAENVLWMVDTNSSDENPKREKFVNLKENEFALGGFSWTYSQSGNYNPKVIVDFDNLVEEFNESNNEMSIFVKI